ncbi:helix-turn-helix transcriptional regulator [Streptomyces sp. UP1A-1]|nr:helix-turn-helix transcriptional regulator [Streptomyces sp. UP1A-1]
MRDTGMPRTALTCGNAIPLGCGTGMRYGDAGEGETVAGDDFAGLLGELKDRSGLSYGALGKRLHMSASTLHRYVSGEVVPVEFAPVERLARVCRATPEELLELHRRWIRADALRGVKKNEGASASAAGAGVEGRPEGERERSQGPAEPTAPVAELGRSRSGARPSRRGGRRSGRRRTRVVRARVRRSRAGVRRARVARVRPRRVRSGRARAESPPPSRPPRRPLRGLRCRRRQHRRGAGGEPRVRHG